MLTRLGNEDDGADTLDLHAGGIPKLDGASDIGVKLSEEFPSTGHVMGAPVLRHHTSVRSLLEPSSRRACALGSSRWRRATVADAAGDNPMLVCARSRSNSSSSTYATWA
jgi:hypothetical protein